MALMEVAAARVAYRGLLAAAEMKVGTDRGKKTALYLLVTGCGIPGALAAEVYGSTKQYVSRILGEVEDSRDDPQYDAAVTELERRIFEEA